MKRIGLIVTLFGNSWPRICGLFFVGAFLCSECSSGELIEQGRAKRLEIQCGHSAASIECKHKKFEHEPDSARHCNANSLIFQDLSTGHRTAAKTPEVFKHVFTVEKTPIGLACTSNAKDSYLLVEYSACPRGTDYAACLHFDLFTSEGVRLTTGGKGLDSEMAKRGLQYRELATIE